LIFIGFCNFSGIPDKKVGKNIEKPVFDDLIVLTKLIHFRYGHQTVDPSFFI